MSFKKLVLTGLVLLILLPTTALAAPIVTSVSASSDTFIMTGPFSDQSGLSTLVTGTGGGGLLARTLIKFNVALPANAYVQSAMLNLKGHSILGSHNASVFTIRSNWVASTVAWPGPDYEAGAVATTTIASAPPSFVNYQWDVSSAVRRWQANEIANYGLLLIGDEVTTSFQNFASSESGVGPVLEITYDIVPPSPPTPTPTPAPGATTPAPATQQKILSTLLSLSAKPKVIKAGKAVLIKGEIRDINGMPVKNKRVNIKANGKLIKQAVTNSMGMFQFKHKPKKSTKYTAAFAGDSSYQATSSKEVKVKVKKAKTKKKKK